MNLHITLAKERQKFSAAHFTLFQDGGVERLHGHDYRLAVTFVGDQVQQGILIPFRKVKNLIGEVCDALDERVLIPTQSPWVSIEAQGEQCTVQVATPKVNKYYSFPRDEVYLLESDNVSCENLVHVLIEELRTRVIQLDLGLVEMEVSLAETAGQSVRATCSLDR